MNPSPEMNSPVHDHVRFLQVDTYSHIPYSGNPTGVIPEFSHLSEEQMSLIARQLGYADSVFCSAASGDDHDAVLTIISGNPPNSISGNALIGAAHVLLETGGCSITDEERGVIRFRTSDGILPISVVREKGDRVYFTDAGRFLSERASQYKVDLIRVLNIVTSDYDPQFTIQKSSVLLVPLRRLHTLLTLTPAMAGISVFLQTRKIDGICVYATETIDRDSTFHLRFFSNRNGAMEEPATGFVHAQVASYLLDKGYIKATTGIQRITSEQGDAMGRCARMQIEIDRGEDGKIIGAMVGGMAVIVARGDIRIPR